MQPAAAVPPSFRALSCDACRSLVPKLLQCAGCGCVNYCGVACQKADWPGHRDSCRHMASLPAERRRVVAANMATRRRMADALTRASPLSKKIVWAACSLLERHHRAVAKRRLRYEDLGLYAICIAYVGEPDDACTVRGLLEPTVCDALVEASLYGPTRDRPAGGGRVLIGVVPRSEASGAPPTDELERAGSSQHLLFEVLGRCRGSDEELTPPSARIALGLKSLQSDAGLQRILKSFSVVSA